MNRFTTLLAVLVAVSFVATACGKKAEETGEKKTEKVEKAEKTAEPAAEEKAAEPAAEEKTAEPAAEEKTAEPAAEEKTAEPAAEEKTAEPAAEPSTAREGGAASEPAAEPEAVNPHSASADNLLVATYEVPGLDEATAKQLTLALSDRDGVVSAKADQEKSLFQVTYSSGCPHSMEGALKGVVAETKLQGVTARGGDAPATGACGGCANKATCGGHGEGL